MLGHQWREVENDLRPELLDEFLSVRYENPLNIRFHKNSRLENAITKAIASQTGEKIRCEKSKVFYAREFCQLMRKPDVEVEHLAEWLNRLVSLIQNP